MRARFFVFFWLNLLGFSVSGLAQTELILPLNEQFIPSALNPAGLGEASDHHACIAFRNQIQFHQSKRSYTGNLLTWESPVGTSTLHTSDWGIQVFSADEIGLKRLKFNTLYAFGTPLSENLNLRLGVQIGYDYQKYSQDYLFPDEISGTSDPLTLHSRESLSAATGGELTWKSWTIHLAFHQLGNRIGKIRSLYSLEYRYYFSTASIFNQINPSIGIYCIEDQNIIRTSCTLKGDRVGVFLAQYAGMKKSENTSMFGLSYRWENVHFQYSIGYSYLDTQSISSSGFRNEFGVIYTFLN